MLLNPDTELLPGALERLAGFIQQTPAVGAVGPRTLNPDHSLQTSCYPMPTLAREFWRLFHLDKFRPFGVYDMSRWDHKVPRKVDVLLGACILFRNDALDEVGLLSEEYFMYSEEVDLCYRLGKGGWEVYWLPEAEMIHYGGQSTVQVSREMFIHLYQSKLLFFRKNYGSGNAFVYKMILLFSALTRLCLTPLAYVSSSTARKEKLELAHNYSQLVKVLLFN